MRPGVVVRGLGGPGTLPDSTSLSAGIPCLSVVRGYNIVARDDVLLNIAHRDIAHRAGWRRRDRPQGPRSSQHADWHTDESRHNMVIPVDSRSLALNKRQPKHVSYARSGPRFRARSAQSVYGNATSRYHEQCRAQVPADEASMGRVTRRRVRRRGMFCNQGSLCGGSRRRYCPGCLRFHPLRALCCPWSNIPLPHRDSSR